MTKGTCLKILRWFEFFSVNALLQREAQTKVRSVSEDHTMQISIMMLFTKCGFTGVNPRILKSIWKFMIIFQVKSLFLSISY